MWNHTVSILIGGQSRRMGTPKHLIELPNGNTMLQQMLLFAHSTATNVVIVGGVIDGYTSIHDHRDTQGPLAGIEALLDSGIDKRYLVVGCDMPLLTKDVVAPLLSGDKISVFTHNGFIFSLPIMICSESIAACTAYLDSSRRSIKGFLSEISHTTVHLEDSHVGAMTRMNTPDEISTFFM